LNKILIIFGTRPEAIKMAPLIKKLEKNKKFKILTCVTAQHREMLDSVLTQFEISPEYDLNLMSHGQTISEITSRVLTGLGNILALEKPDLMLVHGDTTTTFAAALSGFYNKIPVGHVEAGLRSGNIYSPYPEEMNRMLTDTIASIYFAPTEGNKMNLLRSGAKEKQIHVTGNTVIDALYMVVKENFHFCDPALNRLDYDNRQVILLTSHRRENWGHSMKMIFTAVKEVIERNPGVILVFPVHLNPIVKNLASGILGSVSQALLIQPLDYVQFANLMARSYLIMTDSGGIQEEAPALGKPVIVLRTETERPEAVDAGTVKVVGVKKDNIVNEVELLLRDNQEYERMAKAVNPYGDGRASERIDKALLKWFRFSD